jgi:hypothetical protein
MTTLYWLGVVLLVVTAAMLLRYRARHPKRADKWEKSEIVKQLLAKSELEAAGEIRQASVRTKPTVPNKRATKIPPKPTPVHARTRRQA